MNLLTHNSYLLLLAENGLVGAIIFLAFLMQVIKAGFHKEVRRRPVVMCFATGLAVLLVSGFTWGVFTKKIFWIWLGFLFVESYDVTHSQAKVNQSTLERG